MRTACRSLLAFARRWLGAEDGNLTIIFALSAVPVLFGLGAAVDYGYAVKTRAQMNAAADAAALAAVTSYEMQQSPTVAQAAAKAMFTAQVSNLPRVTFNPNNLTVCIGPATQQTPCPVQDTVANGKRVRTVTVTYKASSITAFAPLLGVTSITIGGTSTATATGSPNIDFYLMVDTSPSMAIPATTTGINWMVANTPAQSGCAFACHEKNPQNENPALGNPGGEDNYALAKQAGIVLRMDLVTKAIADLVTTAQTTSAQTGATYRMAAYTFDASVNKAISLQTPSSGTQNQANNIQMLEVDSNNILNGIGNSDEDTNFDQAFTTVSAAMTAAGAGTGTNSPGDKPQQVLMIVSDGVADENALGVRTYLPLGSTTNLSAQTTDWCTLIKANSNVRIAVLYLTYNPLPSNSWYTQYIAPEQSEISPVMQNCASPGLFFQVNTDGDVSSALSALFLTAVGKTARLSN